MLKWVKSFKSVVNEQIQLIVLVVLSLVALYAYVGSARGILGFMQGFLPVLLVLGAIWLLYIKKKYLAAHLVMFLIIFADGLGQFVRWLFSYHFFFKSFQITFDLNLILSLLACAYLIVIILSYVLNDGIHMHVVKPSIILLILVFLLYHYLRDGLYVMLIVGLYVLISLNEDGPELAALLLMLSSVINTPFRILARFIDKTTQFTTVFVWLMDVYALGLIGLSILFFILNAPKLGFKKIV